MTGEDCVTKREQLYDTSTSITYCLLYFAHAFLIAFVGRHGNYDVRVTPALQFPNPRLGSLKRGLGRVRGRTVTGVISKYTCTQ